MQAYLVGKMYILCHHLMFISVLTMTAARTVTLAEYGEALCSV
jgi:hypothetical protein